MAEAESNIVKQIRLELSKRGVVTWLNVRGLFWTMDRRRKVRAGLLADGSSDLIGFKRVLVTQAMIGQQIAVLVCIEVKTDKGRASEAQKDFIAFVKESGGYAGIARSPEDAKKIIEG